MAQVDVSIHRLEDFTVEAKTSEHVFWVTLTPKATIAAAGLTLFANSAEHAQMLTSAFEQCGAQRVSETITELPASSEDCTGNAAEEFAHGTSERR